MRASWSIQTPSGRAGPVAIVQIVGDVSAACDRLGIGPVTVGPVLLRDLPPAGQVVVVRWADNCLHLMPHGGGAAVRSVLKILQNAGLAPEQSLDPCQRYPEARDRLEARLLDVLARARSPLGIDLLLDQPRRWAALESGVAGARQVQATHAAALEHLIDPPSVVLAGPTNVGKSTLVNALVGRSVAIISDEPGTTRDHVGVSVELAGLVVRLIDTPGQREGGDDTERRAQALAQRLRRSAQMVLCCGDAEQEPTAIEPAPGQITVRLALRTDLGPAAWAHDARVSAARGRGIEDLARLIRDRLVPPAALSDPGAWRFWERPGA